MTQPVLTPEAMWQLARLTCVRPHPTKAAAVIGIKQYDVARNAGRERLATFSFDAPTELRYLTGEDHSASEPVFSPDGETLFFTRKPPGEEHAQLFALPLSGGEARKLTSLPLGVSDPRCLPDGTGVIVVSEVDRTTLSLDGTRAAIEARTADKSGVRVTEDRVYRYWDRWLTADTVPHFFRVDLRTSEVLDLTPDSRRFFHLMDASGQYDVSPDGRELAFSANTTEPPYAELRYGIFTVDLASCATTCITPQVRGGFATPRYAPDGSALYFLQSDDAYFTDHYRLVRQDRASGATTSVTRDFALFPKHYCLSRDGETAWLEVDDRARTCLYRVEARGGVPTKVTHAESSHGLSRASDGSVLFLRDSFRSPADVWRLDAKGHATQLTRLNETQLAPLLLGSVEELDVPGADGDAVHSWLVYPPGVAPGSAAAKQLPLVHLVHGGPQSYYGDQWHFRWNAQLFAARGFLVAMVNFHGSESYGEPFARSILGGWGDKPATDVLAVTDHLVRNGVVDEKRMVVAGGSYGGYLAAWLTTVTDRFACSVAHAAVTNLATLYASDMSQLLEVELGAFAWEDRPRVDRWSPTAHAGKIKTPTLVIHGERDFRVPLDQGLELYGVLKARGVPARLVVFPKENHWVTEPQGALRWYAEVFAWLSRYVGDTARAAR